MNKEIKLRAKILETATGNFQAKMVALFFRHASYSLYKTGAGFFGALLFLTVLLNFGCETPSLKKVNSPDVPPQANAQEEAKPGLEADLETMRNANFDYIYVFRRRDGGTFDSEDKKYLKANSPVATNRFILTDENKAVVAGSSYKFEPENLYSLQKRFVIENFSQPENQDAQTANQNSPEEADKQENTNR